MKSQTHRLAEAYLEPSVLCSLDQEKTVEELLAAFSETGGVPDNPEPSWESWGNVGFSAF